MSLIIPLGIVGGVFLLALGGHALTYFLLRRYFSGHRRAVACSLLRYTRRPNQLLVPLAAAEIAAAIVPLARDLRSSILHGIGIALVLAVSWLLVGLTYVLEDALLHRYQLGVEDNLRARQVRTQVEILRRVVAVVLAVLALGTVLLSFDQVRAAGAGILASAGVVGVLVGVAVTPMAQNLISGVQLALTQPIRVDDVVVIDGHWGRIEEIHLTYVVVRVWDLRRLVVPISHFTQSSFENWTRSTANILGWVLIDVDYSMPIEALRRQAGAIVRASPRWDGELWNLQVTNLGHETVQVRVLMSSADSSASWDLQCEVREKLLTFLQDRYPWAVPRVRAEVGWTGADGDASHREAAASSRR